MCSIPIRCSRSCQSKSTEIDLNSIGVIFYDAAREELEVAYVLENGRPLQAAQHMRVPLAEGGLTGWVIQQRQPLLFGDLETEALPAAPDHISSGARAWLGVPLVARKLVLGAIAGAIVPAARVRRSRPLVVDALGRLPRYGHRLRECAPVQLGAAAGR